MNFFGRKFISRFQCLRMAIVEKINPKKITKKKSQNVAGETVVTRKKMQASGGP